MDQTSRGANVRTVVGLVIGAIALIAGVAWAALGAAQPARQGIRVRFATIDSASGQQGSAFLLFSSRDISVTRAAAGGLGNLTGCGGATTVRATARTTRGTIRAVTIEAALLRASTVDLERESGGCPRPRVNVQLDTGAPIDASRGTIRVTAFSSQPGGRIAGTFSVTAVTTSPLTITGTFELRVPRPAAQPEPAPPPSGLRTRAGS